MVGTRLALGVRTSLCSVPFLGGVAVASWGTVDRPQYGPFLGGFFFGFLFLFLFLFCFVSGVFSRRMGLGGILDLLRLRGWLGSGTDVCLAALPLRNEPGRCMDDAYWNQQTRTSFGCMLRSKASSCFCHVHRKFRSVDTPCCPMYASV